MMFGVFIIHRHGGGGGGGGRNENAIGPSVEIGQDMVYDS